jgi:hypothetical protein
MTQNALNATHTLNYLARSIPTIRAFCTAIEA